MVKPNLFIVGAAKCGTTTLYEYLNHHPDIFMCSVKEPHFFSDVKSNNPSDYIPPKKGEKYFHKIINDLEVYLSLFEHTEHFKYRGEASISYLYDPVAGKRIFEFNAGAKIIAILRNPIERAFSHFKADCMTGVAEYPDDFYKQLLTDWQIKDKKLFTKGHFYVELGFYTQQLERYFQVFPNYNILILNFGDFKNNPINTMRKVFQFLEIEENISFDNLKIYNESKKVRNKFLWRLKKMKNSNVLLTDVSRNMPQVIKNIFYTKNKTNNEIDPKAKTFLEDIYKQELIQLKDKFGLIF